MHNSMGWWNGVKRLSGELIWRTKILKHKFVRIKTHGLQHNQLRTSLSTWDQNIRFWTWRTFQLSSETTCLYHPIQMATYPSIPRQSGLGLVLGLVQLEAKDIRPRPIYLQPRLVLFGLKASAKPRGLISLPMGFWAQNCDSRSHSKSFIWRNLDLVRIQESWL